MAQGNPFSFSTIYSVAIKPTSSTLSHQIGMQSLFVSSIYFSTSSMTVFPRSFWLFKSSRASLAMHSLLVCPCLRTTCRSCWSQVSLKKYHYQSHSTCCCCCCYICCFYFCFWLGHCFRSDCIHHILHRFLYVYYFFLQATNAVSSLDISVFLEMCSNLNSSTLLMSPISNGVDWHCICFFNSATAPSHFAGRLIKIWIINPLGSYPIC